MHNTSELRITRYVLIVIVIGLMIALAVWYFSSDRKLHANTDPKKGYVCLNSTCNYRKKCTDKNLLFFTTAGAREESQYNETYRIEKSEEC